MKILADRYIDKCPLCSDEGTRLFHEDKKRSFYQCSNCGLVFVPSCQHLSLDAEKRQYDFHQNDPSDKGYVLFLNQLVKPLVELLSPGMSGLDYGCGPGPTVSKMLESQGFVMSNYDPIYNSDEDALFHRYDFVTCTEVVEHFCDPLKEWKKLIGLVGEGGLLGVMTDRVDTVKSFVDWHYIRDITHVSFYSKKTFQWIADHFNLEVSFPGNRVAILKR